MENVIYFISQTNFIRVKSIIHMDWIFCFKECWNIISKQNDYFYGGTRKLKGEKNPAN